MFAQFRRFVASLLIVALVTPFPAHAGLIATDAVIKTGHHERIASLIDRADVQARLQAYGVSPAQMKARVAALSDDEAAQVAGQIDTLPAGGNALIGAIVLIFLVLLITDILGFTKIFPFTRPVR